MIYGIILIFYLILAFVSVTVLYANWKFYKFYYKLLKVEDFKKANSAYYNQVVNDKLEFVWFANKNTFMAPNMHLSAAFYTWFDPYSTYWWFKYRAWFKKNCKHLDYYKILEEKLK